VAVVRSDRFAAARWAAGMSNPPKLVTSIMLKAHGDAAGVGMVRRIGLSALWVHGQ
jgi:hypothetical protein